MAPRSDYQAVLADLKEQRKQLDLVISVLERQIAGARVVAGAAATLPVNSPEGPSQAAFSQGAFLGLKLPEAIRRYLQMTKRPQTAKEIAEGLREAGMIVTAKHFYSNVYTALIRGKRSGDFTHHGKEWLLAEWRPGRGKRPEEQDSEQA
jgi:hypothetical protein